MNTVIIGVAGGSASGKTTLVRRVIARLKSPQVIQLAQDDYFHPAQQPEEHWTAGIPNYDHPTVLDWKLMKEQLTQIKQGMEVKCPRYDYITGKRSGETRLIPKVKVVFVEGIYALYDPEIRSLLNLRVFLNVDPEERLKRRLKRDVAERGYTQNEALEEYFRNVSPMYEAYVKNTIRFADQVYDENQFETAEQELANFAQERKY